MRSALPVQIGAAAIGVLLALILHVGLARVLTVEQFALYGLALAVQHMAMIFQDGGFRVLVLREHSRVTDDAPLSPDALLSLALGHSISATAAIVIVIGLVPRLGELAVLLPVAVLGGLAKTWLALISNVLFARQRYLAEAAWQTGGRVCALAAGLAAGALASATATAVLTATLIVQAVALAPGFHGVALPRLTFHLNTDMYRTALPLLGLSLLTTLYFRTGNLFLYTLQPDLAELARFTLGHRLVDAAITVAAPAAQMAFVRLRRRELTLVSSTAAIAAAVYGVGAMLVIAITTIAGEPLLAMLAGDAYRGVGALLPLFTLVLTIALPNFLLMQALLATGRDHVLLVSAGSAVVAGAVVNAILVPSLGALGACIALTVSELVQCAFLIVALLATSRTGPATMSPPSRGGIRRGAAGLLHRHVWPMLPQRLRRTMLREISNRAAPPITAGVTPMRPLIVAGAFSTPSGLGESARLCYSALDAAGVPVIGVDLSSSLMQPATADGFAFRDGRTMTGPGTLIVHVNSPLMALAALGLGRTLIRDKYVIGYWAWELPKCPDEWLAGLRFVHEIWVPSSFTADAVRHIAGDRIVRVVPHPVAFRTAAVAARRNEGNRPFTVLSIFNMASSFARKNPLAAITAFKTAFADDPSARLILKTSHSDAYRDGLQAMRAAIGGAGNIAILDGTMSAQELDSLYAQSDVLISLHRSEGFGLTLAEAMLRGLPVVATDWSGSTDFLDHSRAMPIPFELVRARDPQQIYDHPDLLWADADVVAAAAALMRLRENPILARNLAEAAARYAADAWSAERYAETVAGALGRP